MILNHSDHTVKNCLNLEESGTKKTDANFLIENAYSILREEIHYQNDSNLLVDFSIELTTPFDLACNCLNNFVLYFGPLYLIGLSSSHLDILPEHLKPQDSSDLRFDQVDYWLDVEKYLAEKFKISQMEAGLNQLIDPLKQFMKEILDNPEKLKSKIINELLENLRGLLFVKQNEEFERKKQEVKDLVLDVKKAVNFEPEIFIKLSSPIDPYFASAFSIGNVNVIKVSPLIMLDFDNLPEEIRPANSSDKRLFDLNFLQALSDWIAKSYAIPKRKVGLSDIATVKTVLKMKENPLQFERVIRAGLAHEIGHLEHQHSSKLNFKPIAKSYMPFIGIINAIRYPLFRLINFFFTTKKFEFEADRFAATRLSGGSEGIKIGFTTWQESMLELREYKGFHWITRLALKFMITPSGNSLPLLFTHGSFQERIKRTSSSQL